MNTAVATATARRRSVRAWLANPWSQARFLWVIAIAYVVWSLLPAVIAVIFSFNAGKAQTTWQGFSLTRWYVSDVNSVWPPCRRNMAALTRSVRRSARIMGGPSRR